MTGVQIALSAYVPGGWGRGFMLAGSEHYP
jgi:hypothetical protein